ncbi:MAG: hypothetical protein ACFB4I_02810 [Cyanophyceae cyanobacterium]
MAKSIQTHQKIFAGDVHALKDLLYDAEARPVWEIVVEIGSQIPQEEWQKVTTDPSNR